MMKSAFVCLLTTIAASGQVVSLSQPTNVGSSMAATLTNNGTSAISAYLVVCRMYEGAKKRREGHLYMDARVNLPDKVIAPGEGRLVTLFPAVLNDRYRSEVQVEAAVFTDGSSFGDPPAVALIRERRQRMYDAITTYDSLLRSAWRTGGRLSASKAIAAQQAEHLQLARADRVDLARHSAEDLVGRFVSDAIGNGTETCDESCAGRRLSIALSGLTRWKTLVSTGLSEAPPASR